LSQEPENEIYTKKHNVSYDDVDENSQGLVMCIV